MSEWCLHSGDHFLGLARISGLRRWGQAREFFLKAGLSDLALRRVGWGRHTLPRGHLPEVLPAPPTFDECVSQPTTNGEGHDTQEEHGE